MGEVTVPNLQGFNSIIHVKVLDVQSNACNRNNLERIVFPLPWTKAPREKGEKIIIIIIIIFWAKQAGGSDPLAAPQNHLRINNTRPIGTQGKIATSPKLIHIVAHGISVGSTLEHLRGIPFDIVKA